MHDDKTSRRVEREQAEQEAPREEAQKGGSLALVATPIGNLDDLSPRAIEALRSADLVACEDTRRTGQLLSGLGFKRPLVSVNEHNERQRLGRLLGALEEGQRIALVSDAGTPLLSDPGFLLTREAARRGVRIEPIPGASALLSALVASGLPPYPFSFLGFPPRKPGKRRAALERLLERNETIVFYEAPHRILATLDELIELADSDRDCVVARELTKIHEELLRGRLTQVRDDLAGRERVRGEMVVVVGPRSKENTRIGGTQT